VLEQKKGAPHFHVLFAVIITLLLYTQTTPPHRPPQQQLSFQEVITEIAGEDGGARQQDVTLPFYFICLLHLANEHVSCFVDVVVSVEVAQCQNYSIVYLLLVFYLFHCVFVGCASLCRVCALRTERT